MADFYCPRCGSEDFIMIEYVWSHPDHYDGISEYRCTKCNTRYGRWTGKILKEGESEPPYGKR